MKYPKISIITPSFNQGNFLEQTIKSVVGQSYPNLEYLIIDGGSKDESVSIIKKYSKKYPNIIKWKSGKDNGQVDAINQGIKMSTGDIVAYLNSDDYYLPNSLKTVAAYFENNPQALWLVGRCLPSDKALNWTFKLKDIWPIQYFKVASYFLNTINQPSVFLKKDLINRVGIFNSKYPYSFDHEYWLRCLQYSLPSRINKTLSVFRIHPKSISNKMYHDQLKQDYEIVKKYSNNNKLLLALHSLGQKIVIQNYKKLK